MKFDWKDWLQLISNFAIIIGIVLVILELQQNKDLARAQLLAERVSQRISTHLALAGENPGPIFIKACLEPNDFTSQDKFVIAQIFQARIESGMSIRTAELVAGLGANYLDNLSLTYDAMFNYEYGKEYFVRMKPYLPDDAVALGEEILSRNTPSDCAEGSAKPTGF